MEISLEVPEQYFFDENPAELGRRIKLYAAILMFRARQLSAGAACELAGVDRYTFAAECHRHRVPLTDYPPGELEDELEGLTECL